MSLHCPRPLPPTPHARLPMPVHPKSSFSHPPSIQRRRSRDPNVADRLVIELDDDHQPNVSTGPDPPAYCSLPPPYSATTDDKKFTLVVEDEDPPQPHTPSPPPPTPSSSHKKSRISTSELRVLVYLYRTVVYGLESRNRKSDAPPQKKKPLGPRSSLPVDKSHFESALAAAAASTTHSLGFAQFPLVEDDLDLPKTPFHSPSHSPRSSSPLPFLLPSSLSSPKLKKEKSKSEINAELHVQDALLALRLKEFLRAQGVCEDDLKVDFDDQGRMVDPAKAEIKKSSPPAQQEEEDDEETNILDEYFMGIEEEEHGAKTKLRGPIVEDDDDDDVVLLDSPFVELEDDDKPPTPPLQITTTLAQQRFSSPPPPASPSPRPHAVLPTSYMVALLTMRVRHPSKKPSPSNNDSTGINDKGRESRVKRKSGLRVVVEVD